MGPPPNYIMLLGASAAAIVGAAAIAWRMLPRKKIAKLMYQSDRVPRSLTSSQKVYVERDVTGTDPPFVGVEWMPTPVSIRNGRGAPLTLDQHGVKFGRHTGIEGIDFYDEDDIIGKYYEEVRKLVMEATGAKRVVVFDHNVRKTKAHHKGGQEKLKGGNAVQTPLQIVHGDYTLASAPLRVRMLSDKPKANDTLAKVLEGKPLIDPCEIDGLLEGRYAFINLWRSFSNTPVQDQPLAVCDGSSCSPKDLVVFEVRYADRTGENYFAAHSPSHKWYNFPHMTKDEVIFLKCWDSAGVDFAGLDPATAKPIPGAPPGTVPATFSLHSAFGDPDTPPDCPPRESIECRTVAFW